LMHLLEIGIAQAYDKLGQHQRALDMVLKLLPEIKNDQLDCRIEALEIGISSALYVDKVDTANTFLAEALHLIRLNPGEVYGANRMNDLAMCYADTNHPEKSEQIFTASCNDRKAYGTLYDDAAIMLARFYNGTDQPHKSLS
ncbi:hypothetical protein, partial [Corallococcus sp. CA041A]|uniref:hypothetical protein n=1 Tax=Corallococcus sp. CA041A TaxID=2316727 RepID=UPI0013156FCF